MSIKNLEENEDRVKIRFSVKDSGIGIPKEKQKDIFKAFTQADGSITRKFGGTGLGLTISSKIVEKLGGEIKLESEVNKGSEFYFELEFEKCQSNLEEEKKEFRKNYKAHILIAEDDKFNQELIKAILKEWDISFDIASDGEEAIKKVKENNYDLIFLDINMPKMSGLEALKEIKKLTNIPVIALTANAFKEDVEKYFKEGFDDYVAKPVKLEDFQAIFDKYLDKNFLNYLEKSLKLSKDVIESLVEVYFSNVEKDLEKLKKAIEENNLEDIAKFAHKIKGSSLNLGLNEVANIAATIEKSAKNEEKIEYKTYFNKLYELIENLRERMKNE